MKVHESQRKPAKKPLSVSLFKNKFSLEVTLLGIFALGMLVLYLGCAAVR